VEHRDDEFCGFIADQLAALRHVQAISLGGSRATGTHRPGGIDDVLSGLATEPEHLTRAIDAAAALLRDSTAPFC
jgi:hypothetical protein